MLCGVGTGSPDKVFEWIVPTDGTYTFTVTGTGGFRPTVALYADGLDGWNMACGYVSTDSPSVPFVAKLKAGVRLAFAVETYQGSTGGAFTITATRN